MIVTSDYSSINYDNINGIEILMGAFSFHFGSFGKILLSIITMLFAFSTIISGYFFGENNLGLLIQNKTFLNLFKYFVLLVIVLSSFISAGVLWNLTDFFISILAIINILAMIMIDKKK